MKRAFFSVLRVWLFVALLVSSIASAQTKAKPVRDELPRDALAAWDDGRLLLDLKTPDYEKALVKFKQAYALSKNPRTLFNVAYCERNLGRYARAKATLQQELTEGGSRLPPEEVQEIKAAMAALGRYITTLEVLATEPEAEIFLDEQRLGRTPLPPTEIDIGSHTLRLQKPGFHDLTKAIVVNGPTKEMLTLEPLQRRGKVEISVSGASNAKVKIDGVDMGPAPFSGQVAVGRHTFTAEAPGRVSVSQTSEVKYGEALNLTLVLAEKRNEGRLTIHAAPSGALIEIDGKGVGSTNWEGVLATGSHQVTIRKVGYQPVTFDIMITDNAVIRREITLTESTGVKWVAWVLGGAAVIGGGIVAGYFIAQSEQDTLAGSLRQREGTPVPTSFRFGAIR